MQEGLLPWPLLTPFDLVVSGLNCEKKYFDFLSITSFGRADEAENSSGKTLSQHSFRRRNYSHTVYVLPGYSRIIQYFKVLFILGNIWKLSELKHAELFISVLRIRLLTDYYFRK